MNQPTIKELIVAYKNHVDIGFTEPEAKVLHDACRWMLPEAATRFKKLREEGEPVTWCVPAYIATLALEWLDGEPLRAVDEGFAAGDLSWHALPFTTHTELLDESLLEAMTAMSRRLDQRFGQTTTVAKMTDVPSHTLGLVRALARHGIQALHIGVNWMSPSPEIPPVSRWQDGEGNELVLIIDPKSYGGMMRLPGEDRAFYWNMVGDNCEVPSNVDVRSEMAKFRSQHPGAIVRGGRADEWAGNDLLTRSRDLPVVSVDLGDSWIFGTGSDPWKTQRFRELIRLRREWLASHRLMPEYKTSVRFDQELLLVSEHTWGGSHSCWTMHNRTDWNNNDFASTRKKGCWKALEASWQEQRDHVDNAVAALAAETQLHAEAVAACDDCLPRKRGRTGWQAIDATLEHTINGITMRLDSCGALVSINGGEERLAGPSGLLLYQTFDHADCQRAVDEYSTWKADWLLEEFSKMGLDGTDAVSRIWEPRVLACWRRGHTLAVDLAFEETAITKFGAPRHVTLTYDVSPGRLDMRLDWFDKYATRLPEALWWSFQPKVADPYAWRIDKCGQWIDPRSIPQGGGKWLHGVQSGAKNGDIKLLTRDAHLLAVGSPMLYRFPREDVEPSGGVHLNLVNNLWGTNFPQWCGDDLAFRATLMWA